MKIESFPCNLEYERTPDGSISVDNNGLTSPTGEKVIYANITMECDLTSLAGENKKDQKQFFPFPSQKVPETLNVQVHDHPGNKPYPLAKELNHRTLEGKIRQAIKDSIEYHQNTNLKDKDLNESLARQAQQYLANNLYPDNPLKAAIFKKDKTLRINIEEYFGKKNKPETILTKIAETIKALRKGISLVSLKELKLNNIEFKISESLKSIENIRPENTPRISSLTKAEARTPKNLG
jgi:hypothetical protein